MKIIILCLGMSLILNHIICFVILNNTVKTIKINYFQPEHHLTFIKSNETLELQAPLSEFIVSEGSHIVKNSFGPDPMVMSLSKYTDEQLNDISTIFFVKKNIHDNFFTIDCNVNIEEKIIQEILEKSEEQTSITSTESRSKLLRFRKRMLLGSSILGATIMILKIYRHKKDK